MKMKFETRDSGKREEYASGMVRDIAGGKTRFDLIPVMPLRRLAELYTRGAAKYGDRNWELANSEEELQRFKASCLRHLYQWLAGETDEDHAIGAVWNIFAYLTIEAKLDDEPNIFSRYDHVYEKCWCDLFDGESHCGFCEEMGAAHADD